MQRERRLLSLTTPAQRPLLAVVVLLLMFSFGNTAPAHAQGPNIPAGFVQRVITCNVAVYDVPAGNPVGANRVRVGQSWYVNPRAVAARDGSLWIAVFISGARLVYVPAQCVSGQPGAAPVTPPTTNPPPVVNPGQPKPIGGISDGARGTILIDGTGRTIYIVAQGDRLYRIALRFGIAVSKLAAANGISNYNLIYPGQRLVIPR